jgi:hypothetical protein
VVVVGGATVQSALWNRATAWERSIRRSSRTRCALGLLVSAWLPLAGCGDGSPDRREPASEIQSPATRSEAPVSRVILLGIDGLSWNVLTPLVESGRVPNLARFLARGASGELYTTIPTYSPIIWATIATGKTRDEHGIGGFAQRSADAPQPVPLTSVDRRVKTVWNILGDAGKRVAVVGWWTTRPAEPVSGVLVSDRMLYNRFNLLLGYAGFGRDLPQQTWPRGLAGNLSDLAIVDEHIATEMFERFLPLATEKHLEPNLHDPYYELFLIYARDVAYRKMLDRVRATETFDFVAFYLNGVDIASHYFWKYRFPEEWKEPIDPTLVRVNGEVIDRYMIYLDGTIGALLDEADEDTVVIVVSDHGFATGERPDSPNISGIHYDRAPPGVVAIAGGHVQPGSTIEGSSIFDITPTVLHLLGRPVASDMSGAVLPAAVGGGANLATRPVQRIATYEDGQARRKPVATDYDDAIMRRLGALGYLDDPSAIAEDPRESGPDAEAGGRRAP